MNKICPDSLLSGFFYRKIITDRIILIQNLYIKFYHLIIKGGEKYEKFKNRKIHKIN